MADGYRVSMVAAAVLAASLFVAPAHARTVGFSGYTWEVRSGSGGPGPNSWSSNLAWVDKTGALHLKLAKVNGVWQCAEVYMDKRLGFGAYEFRVTGPVDRLDRNVVLGLFDYPTPDVGPDGTNEIDIEYSHWGDPANPIGNFTVWPAVSGLQPATHTFAFTLTGDQTTQRFTWAPGSILFRALRGFTSADTPAIANWAWRPADPASSIPQHPLPVHLNLWLFQGQPPTDGQPVEIVIESFHFTPQ